MQNLRDTDGTPTHRRAIRFHIGKCRTGGAPLHTQLRDEAAVLYSDLKVKERAHEDADDDLVDATADVDTMEIILENAIRDLDGDLEKYDRDHPGKAARLAVFPAGYGAVIEPEGDNQKAVLPALHTRLKPYTAEPAFAASLAKLDAAETAFIAALKAEEAAETVVNAAVAAELGARAAVRAQLTSAHGRLRDLYKSQPKRAEAFFLKLGRKEGKSKPKGSPDGGGDGGNG
jgi:hypothetical protein